MKIPKRASIKLLFPIFMSLSSLIFNAVQSLKKS